MHLLDAVLDQTVLDRPRILVDIAVCLSVRNLLDHNHIVLIDCGHKIPAILPEILAHFF